MIDKLTLAPGTKLFHKFRGPVLFTEQCQELEKRDGWRDELFVEHPEDGIIRVSLNLVNLWTKEQVEEVYQQSAELRSKFKPSRIDKE